MKNFYKEIINWPRQVEGEGTYDLRKRAYENDDRSF